LKANNIKSKTHKICTTMNVDQDGNHDKE